MSARILLVDHMMPGMMGIELVALLRAARSDLTVLMVTARSQERDIEAGFAAGVDDYLTEPFSRRVLTARVTALLARR